MDVTSVSSSSYTPPPQAQTQRSERTEPTAQKASAKEAQPERTEESKPAPVVNTQGQTTGRIVNTSA